MNINWLPLDINNIPTESGVYAFKKDEIWLYIGESSNLKRRLNKQHVPLEIAMGLDASFFYCLNESPKYLERVLILKHSPTWNGGTSRSINKYPCCELPISFEVVGDNGHSPIKTESLELSEIIKIFEAVDTSTLIGKRDNAILRLMWSNALRRSEICSLDVKHFNRTKLQLAVSNKGTNPNRDLLTISRKTATAIHDWLKASKAIEKHDEPIFISLDPVRFGNRLTGTSIHDIVTKYSKLARINKKVSPHTIRHSAITQALNQNNGNVIAALKLSRHASPDSIITHCNKHSDQSTLTNHLDSLV